MQTTSTITKGLIIALVMIALSLGIYFSGMDMNGPVKWLSSCIMLIGIIVSILQYGKQVDHNATFGNYFAHGFKIAATVTAIMIVYMIAFVYLVPAFKEKALDEAAKAISKQDISDDQKQSALEMTKKMFMVVIIGGTLLSNIILGAISALIGAAIAKKNPRPIHD
jgi:hypothetical protein